jgi:hypothetical protein
MFYEYSENLDKRLKKNLIFSVTEMKRILPVFSILKVLTMFLQIILLLISIDLILSKIYTLLILPTVRKF